MLNSIWADSVNLPSFPQLKKDLKTDLLIVGGGLAGLLCAYFAQQSGIDYALIESDSICHGVTRNTTAKLTCQHSLIYTKLLSKLGEEQARMYYDANNAALNEYRMLCQKIPCDFEEKPSYVYSRVDRQAIEDEMHAMERLGIPAEFCDNTPLPFTVSGAVRLDSQAQFNPLRFAAGIAEGLNIYEHTRAKEFGKNTVITDNVTIKASKIIIATHYPIINKHGGYYLKMYQSRSYVIGVENVPDVGGMYVDESGEGLSFRNYGGALLIGGGAHRTGKPGSAWAQPEAAAQKYYPDSNIKYRWAAQDCMTLDSVPYIGRYGKNTPDLFVATGFNKWGMTSSMAAAMILIDMIGGKENPYAAVFSPSRSVWHPQLFINTGETLKNLLSLSTRRCPHLGCALKWNSAEHSWDCPCHGSRFSQNGELLDNPATGDLKK
ncbi:MAG: FAD-dependent oxidoreductase [Acutalibacteraceae bacterium]